MVFPNTLKHRPLLVLVPRTIPTHYPPSGAGLLARFSFPVQSSLGPPSLARPSIARPVIITARPVIIARLVHSCLLVCVCGPLSLSCCSLPGGRRSSCPVSCAPRYAVSCAPRYAVSRARRHSSLFSACWLPSLLCSSTARCCRRYLLADVAVICPLCSPSTAPHAYLFSSVRRPADVHCPLTLTRAINSSPSTILSYCSLPLLVVINCWLVTSASSTWFSLCWHRSCGSLYM